MRVPYTITTRTASVLVDNRMRVVDASTPNFGKLVAALRQKDHDLDLLRDLVDISRFVARATFGAVQIADNEVRWNGEKVHNVVAERLVAHLQQGHDLEPLATFLGRLMQNPLETARNELYLWLESGNAPITSDGFFLAFKKVRADYKDIHSGTFDNSVGQVVSMPREQVDPNRYKECSVGLHFCSWGYLTHFGGGGGNRVVILQIDPADVVAIPKDYNNQKGRTWRYTVVGEVPEDEAKQFFDGRPLVDVYSAPESTDESEDAERHDPEYEEDAEDILSDLPFEESESPVFTYEPSAPLPEPKKEKLYTSPKVNRSYLASEIVSMVNDHGQRGFSRMTGVPRSTVQEWLKDIQSAG